MAILEVCRADELAPGEAIRVETDDAPVAVYNVGGAFYAIGDTCTHEDFSLADGEVSDDATVECALHGSRFDLRTGAALSLPATGAEPTFRVWVEDGVVKLEVPEEG